MSKKRFEIIFEKHIGLGVRWDSNPLWFLISVSVPFITFCFVIERENARPFHGEL